jgi:hypothetical protein
MITGLFAKVVAEAEGKTREALTATGLAIEREAKLNVGRGGTHKYGTPTPASPGGPPALISGTLRRSVTHTPAAPGLGGWTMKIGTAVGVYPPYPKKGNRTASSKYGYYLETGLRNGAQYPWLLPAAEKAKAEVRGITFSFFRGPWPKI